MPETVSKSRTATYSFSLDVLLRQPLNEVYTFKGEITVPEAYEEDKVAERIMADFIDGHFDGKLMAGLLGARPELREVEITDFHRERPVLAYLRGDASLDGNTITRIA